MFFIYMYYYIYCEYVFLVYRVYLCNYKSNRSKKIRLFVKKKYLICWFNVNVKKMKKKRKWNLKLSFEEWVGFRKEEESSMKKRYVVK